MNEPTPAGIPQEIVKRKDAIGLYTVAVWAMAAVVGVAVIGAIGLAFFGKSMPSEVWLVVGIAVGALARMVGGDDASKNE